MTFHRVCILAFTIVVLTSLSACVIKIKPATKCVDKNREHITVLSSQDITFSKNTREAVITTELKVIEDLLDTRRYKTIIFVNEVYVETSPIITTFCGEQIIINTIISVDDYLNQSKLDGISITAIITEYEKSKRQEEAIHKRIEENKHLNYPLVDMDIPLTKVFHKHSFTNTITSAIQTESKSFLAKNANPNILDGGHITGIFMDSSKSALDRYLDRVGQPSYFTIIDNSTEEATLNAYIGKYPNIPSGLVCLQGNKQINFGNIDSKHKIITFDTLLDSTEYSMFIDTPIDLDFNFEKLSRIKCYILNGMFGEENIKHYDHFYLDNIMLHKN